MFRADLTQMLMDVNLSRLSLGIVRAHFQGNKAFSTVGISLKHSDPMFGFIQ